MDIFKQLIFIFFLQKSVMESQLHAPPTKLGGAVNKRRNMFRHLPGQTPPISLLHVLLFEQVGKRIGYGKGQNLDKVEKVKMRKWSTL